MKLFLKAIFEFTVDQYTLFENPIYNYLAMALVGSIGFMIAWNFVGKLYRLDIIESRWAGSLIHWIVRLIAVTGMVLLGSGLLWLYKTIISIPHWVWLVILIILILIVILLVIRYKRKKITS